MCAPLCAPVLRLGSGSACTHFHQGAVAGPLAGFRTPNPDMRIVLLVAQRFLPCPVAPTRTPWRLNSGDGVLRQGQPEARDEARGVPQAPRLNQRGCGPVRHRAGAAPEQHNPLHVARAHLAFLLVLELPLAASVALQSSAPCQLLSSLHTRSSAHCQGQSSLNRHATLNRRCVRNACAAGCSPSTGAAGGCCERAAPAQHAAAAL